MGRYSFRGAELRASARFCCNLQLSLAFFVSFLLGIAPDGAPIYMPGGDFLDTRKGTGNVSEDCVVL